LTLWKIERVLPDRYGVKKVPFEKYIPGPRGASYLNISVNTLTYRLACHRTAHALRVNEKLFIHPDGMVELLKKSAQARIRRELKLTGTYD